MLTQQYNRRSATERAAKPVTVEADAATNTLVVSAHAEVLPEIEAFVEELNARERSEPDRVTELFPLRVAKAADVASAMEKLYPEPPMPRDSRGRPMPWMQEPREVLVSSDAASNALIIEAPRERMDAFKALAEKLDRVELPPSAELRTYNIVGADINAVTTTLRALASRGNLVGPGEPGKPAVNVVVESEPRSSTLIVAGDETTFERVEQLLDSLSAVPVERSLRVLPIANAEAERVREKAMEIYAAQTAAIPGAAPVEVTVDETANSLMVVAEAQAMSRFMDILQELQRQAGPAREVRLIELEFARAEEVVAFLDDLLSSSRPFQADGGADPVWESIEATNTLMVAAQPRQFPVIEGLVRSLDRRSTADRPPLRILRLRTTEAMALAQVLSQAYNRRPAEQRAQRPVEITADASNQHPHRLRPRRGLPRDRTGRDLTQ